MTDGQIVLTDRKHALPKTREHPNNMYFASAVYLRRRVTFTATFFGETDSSIRRLLQPEKRLRDER